MLSDVTYVHTYVCMYVHVHVHFRPGLRISSHPGDKSEREDRERGGGRNDQVEHDRMIEGELERISRLVQAITVAGVAVGGLMRHIRLPGP